MATGCVYIDGLRSLARANASTLHELRRHFAAHTEREAKLQWEADSVALKRNGTSLRDPAAKAWLLRATAPTSFVTASEIRAKFAGIVFVVFDVNADEGHTLTLEGPRGLCEFRHFSPTGRAPGGP